MALGLAWSSTNKRSGGESCMRGSACFSHVLNALEAYLSKIYFLRVDRFSLVGEQGSTGGSEGGAVLAGQEQGVSPWLTTPELEHLVEVDTLATATEAAFWSGPHEPIDGKSGGIVPRSIQAALDR